MSDLARLRTQLARHQLAKGAEPDRPAWVQDRLDAEDAMGESFEGSAADRIGFSIGTVLRLAWALGSWGIAATVLTLIVWGIGKVLGLW